MAKDLYSEPLTDYSKNEHKRLADHQKKLALFTKKLCQFMIISWKYWRGKMLAIRDQVMLKLDQVIFNETVLESIIETIIFWGHQELSLHGQRDDPLLYNNSLLEFTSVNVGNFWGLIHFRVAVGDAVLKRHILKAPSNAKYMPITIQNELICLLAEGIVTRIMSEGKETRVFLFWQMSSEIVTTLKKCHFLFDLLINPAKLENLFNF